MSTNTISESPETELDNFESRVEHGREMAANLLNASYAKEKLEKYNDFRNNFVLPMEWPIGGAGYIAKAIFSASFLPQQEVAIIATLSLLSGVAGRAYRTPTGATLSQYYLLVAHSGSGKDAIHKIIPRILREIGIEGALNFVAAERFASGAALHRRVLEAPGFLALHAEFGKRLAIISSPKSSGGPDQQFVDKLIEAYEKDYMEGIFKSRPEDCVDGVEWPSLSFLGETTPQTFYRALTGQMMEDGFFSRFITISVTSDRPPPNPAQEFDISGETWDALNPLVERAIKINDTFPLKPISVRYVGCEAEREMDEFEEECRGKINKAKQDDDSFGSAVWSRAHIKALKVASLLAVADDCEGPKICIGSAAWAIDFVRRDVKTLLAKVESGDVGDGDDVRQKKVMQLCQKVVAGKLKDKNKKLNPHGVVTRRVLQTNTSGLAPFKNHPLKASKALDEAIRALVDMGYLMIVDKHEAVELWSEHGTCYRVIRLDDHNDT